jgi:iron complex outermembrane receptor protein
MKSRENCTSPAVASLLLLGGMSCAHAQSSGVSATSDSHGGSRTAAGVEEVVVTAQKRAQKLQKVPIAITALGGKDIAQRGITNPSSLAQHVTGLTISEAAGGIVLPFLRGVGNTAGEVGNESSVAVYLDDVYVSQLNASFLELADVSRIEVLNGPQGTLFGRNASAGVINVITKDPSPTFEANASFGYGSYNTSTEKLYLSGPIAPGIAANLSVLNTWQADGWGHDLTGAPIGFNSPFVIRSKWLFHLSSSTTLRLEGDYSHSSGNEGFPSNTVPGTSTGTPDFYALPPFNRTPMKYTNQAGFYNNDSVGPRTLNNRGFGLSARLDQDLGFAKLASITGYRQDTDDQKLGGYTPDPVGYTELHTESRTFTEELQLASKPQSSFDWLIGLYYLNEFSAYDPVRLTGPSLAQDDFGGAFGTTLPAGSQLELFAQQRVKEYSAFTQETVHLPYAINLTAGVRYTIDDLDGQGRTAAIIPGIFSAVFPGSINTTTEFKEPTFKIGLDHQFTDNVLGYATVSRGIKAGTYNLLPLTLPATQPEVLTDYEVGAKATLFDRKLQVNTALFYYDYANPQVEEVKNQLLFLANAKSARVEGAQIEGQYVVTPDLRTRFGAEYLDAQYLNFPGAPFYTQNPNPPYGATLTTLNAATNQLPYAPKFTFNVGLNYSATFLFGRFNFDSNYAYNGGFAYTPDNVLRQGPFGLLDASLTYFPPNTERWALRLWGRNITSTKYSFGDLESNGYLGFIYSPAPPAEYGATLTYNFGS